MWVCQASQEAEKWALMFHDASEHGFGGQANCGTYLGYDT